MLFVIDSSLADALQDHSKPDDSVIDALSNIALARRQGKHLVFGDRRTLEICAESSWLSDRARRVYTHLHNNVPQMKTYADNLVRRVEVLAEDGILESSGEPERTVIRLSASYLSDFSVLDAAVLLCENQRDTAFYEQLAQVYLHWSKLGHLRLRHDPRGGGGQTTSDEYQSVRSATNRLCLCILDSDRRIPDGPLGGTPRAAQRVHASATQPLCELFILDARTVENLIPTIIYQETVWDDSNRMDGVLVLEHLESSKFADARRYLDIKGGLKLGEIMHAPANSAFRQYWEPVARALHSKAHSVDAQCWSTPKCSSTTDCSCILCRGLGESILEHVIHFLQSKSNQKKAEMVRGSLELEWQSIGELVVAWCCGSSRLIAV